MQARSGTDASRSCSWPARSGKRELRAVEKRARAKVNDDLASWKGQQRARDFLKRWTRPRAAAQLLTNICHPTLAVAPTFQCIAEASRQSQVAHALGKKWAALHQPILHDARPQVAGPTDDRGGGRSKVAECLVSGVSPF